ncbi:MAG: hypothetical protein ACUVSS_14645, partial [Anaerolineae bacterium]
DPAPVFSSCDVVMGTPNNYRVGEWFFLVRWQNNSSAWRSWILKCTGNGASWMWQPVTRAISGELVVNGTFHTNISGWSPTDGCFWDAGNGGRLGMRWRALSHTYTTQTITITESGNYTVSGTFGPRYQGYTNTAGLKLSRGATNWVVFEWVNDEVGTKTTNVYLPANDYELRIYCTYIQNNQIYGYFDDISVSSGVATWTPGYGIWLDCDTSNGDYLYLTIWEDNHIYVKKIRTSSLAVVHSYDLGAATITDVINGTYSAYPRVKEFDPNVVYVHGRLPGGAHLLRSTDAGVSFAPVATTFDSDHHIGAFIVGHDGVLWAVENTGGAPVLWRNTGNGFVAMPPVPLSGNVPPDGITLIPSSSVIALASSTAVVRSADAGVTWTNQSYPAGGSIRSLLFIA